MEIIKYNHSVKVFRSIILDQYFKGMTLGIFDIETLGLSPSKCPIILAGLMSVYPDGFCEITQYFAESPKEEKIMLEALQTELDKFDYLITYNGKHFDLPFIKKRAEVCAVEDFYVKPYNFDLYLCVNGHSDLKKFLPNLKQKSVEEYMGVGVSREDEISGKESIDLYYKYLSTFEKKQKADLKQRILLHNHDDLLQLYKILPVLKQVNIHSALSALGFPVAGLNGWPQLNVCNAKIKDHELNIYGTYSGEPFLFSCYSNPEMPYDCSFTLDREFFFSLQLESIKGNCFLNVSEILGDTFSFEKYPGYVNGFLLLSSAVGLNYLEINMCSKALLQKFMLDNSMPA